MKRIAVIIAALVASFAAHASDTIENNDGDTYTAFPRTLHASKLANGTAQYDMLWQYHILHSRIPSDHGKPVEQRVQVHVTGCDRGMGEIWEGEGFNAFATNKWLREGTQVFDAMALKTCALALEAGK